MDKKNIGWARLFGAHAETGTVGSKTVPTLLLLLLAACTSGPDYVRPALDTPAAYKESGPWQAGEPRDHLPRGKWWQVFGDPVLDALQERLDIGNHSLRVAEAQYRQALAAAQAARAGLFPSLSGTLAASRSETASSAARSNLPGAVTSHNLGLSASWEIDLWGRVARLAEAGAANAAASAADLEAARLSAHALLAQNYFLLRSNERQSRLLEDSAALYEKNLQLTRNRQAAGVATGLDVAQAEAQYRTTRAQAVDLGIQRAQLEHALAVLVGSAPADFRLPDGAFSVGLPVLPAGVPSVLLERRPDIAAAERRMMAANAGVGVTQAAFFPILTLGVGGGFQGDSLSNWFTLPSRYWSLGPSLAQSLFDGGLRRAQSEQAVATWEAATASWRQTALSGFQEVEDQLAALRLLEREAGEQAAAVEAAQRAAQLALNQYRAGTVSYLNVISAQSTALTAERSAADILARRLSASVALIKALGGGWEVEISARK